MLLTDLRVISCGSTLRLQFSIGLLTREVNLHFSTSSNKCVSMIAPWSQSFSFLVQSPHAFIFLQIWIISLWFSLIFLFRRYSKNLLLKIRRNFARHRQTCCEFEFNSVWFLTVHHFFHVLQPKFYFGHTFLSKNLNFATWVAWTLDSRCNLKSLMKNRKLQ